MQSFNLGKASELYTEGFALSIANQELYAKNGTGISVQHKWPILLVAASLNAHRARNRAFLDQFAPVVFRSQPDTGRGSDCFWDPSQVCHLSVPLFVVDDESSSQPPYVPLSTDFLLTAFMV